MDSSSDAWYAYQGPENDVAVSTRVRLARNLAGFVFPSKLGAEDAERVRSLIFDAFSRLENPEQYQTLQMKNLDTSGQRILTERGVFSKEMFSMESAGGVIRTDGRVSCTVNVKDHLRLAAFSTGLSVGHSYHQCFLLDDELQNFLQFAASAECGYLTESLFDAGTGMKCSVLLHLPSLAASGSAETCFSGTLKDGCKIQGCFGSGYVGGIPLGSFYILWNNGSAASSEGEQMALLEQAAQALILAERGMTLEYTSNKLTRLKDSVYRAVAAVKYGRLVEMREGIDLLSRIKWGISAGILAGVDHTALTALLYRMQSGHLSYVLRSGDFNFEKDVSNDETRLERLRSLIIQDTLDDVKILL